MNKKIIATVLAAGMLTSVFAGCGNDGGGSSTPAGSSGSSSAPAGSNGGDSKPAEGGFTVTISEEGYPVCSEPYNVKVLSTYTIPEGKGAWETPNEIPFFKDYAEKTNINLEWELLTKDQFMERLNILIAGDELPDMILKPRNLTAADIVKHGNSGQFIDIEPYLADYAPDFWEYSESHDLTKYLRSGGIWGFPYIYDSDGITISKIFFNTRWMENVGVDKMPSTLDEYHDLFVKFRDMDANGNGDATDEIPLGVYDWMDFFYYFGSCWNLFNRGQSNAYIDADPADASGNTIRMWTGSNEMKDLVKLYKQYYDDGLFSAHVFDTDWGTQFDNAMQADLIGSHDLWTTVAPQETIDEFITVDAPPVGPDGEIRWNTAVGRLGSKGSLMITKNAEHPEALVGWANYFYTQPGAYAYFLGVEGESYIIDEEGHTQLTDLITKNPDGLTQEQALLRYSMYSGGSNPGLATDETFKGGETYWTSLEGNEKFKKYMPEAIWEAIPLSPEQSSEVASVKGDLDAVLKEYFAKFCTGVLDIDSGWDEFQKKLDQAGRERYVAAYQQAYNELNGLA